MNLRMLLAPVCCALPLASAVDLHFLPSGSAARAVAVDSAGNLCVAGEIQPASPKSSQDSSDAFAARLTPDGSRILSWTLLAGSAEDYVTGLAVGPDDALFIVGNTSSRDFPTTPGAMKTASTAELDAFAAKIDAAGNMVWATLIGGTGYVHGTGIAMDPRGQALIAGSASSIGILPTTPGVYSGAEGPFNGGFVMKLNASGSAPLISLRGLGGHSVAYDGQGNIYVLSSDAQAGNLPVTPGGFQTTHALQVCGGGGFGGSACQHPHAAKLSPDGSTLLYATYVTGAYGAAVAAMNVDAEGNLILAGSTNSSDYPVTPGAFQNEYRVTAPPPPQPSVVYNLFFPPPATGFVTKLNATGTGLVWSTFFSGSETDTISGMAPDAQSNLYLTGNANSADLPGAGGVPSACKAAPSRSALFTARLSSDGRAISGTQLIYGLNGFAEYSWGFPAPVALGLDGAPLIATGSDVVASVDARSAMTQACVVDGADGAQLKYAAPGQLASIFGSDLASEANGYGGDAAPTSLGGAAVTFNGIPAPLLYSSPGQINFQVPFEISNQAVVEMKLTGPSLAAPLKRILPVVRRQPSPFLNFDPGASSGCSPSLTYYRTLALALNDDGSLNSCGNPAREGTTVTVFLNGIGGTDPPLKTGVFNASTPAKSDALISLASPYMAREVSASPDPGSISSVWRVSVAVPPGTPGYLYLPLRVEDAVVYETPLVWTAPVR
jgi:uncharacterized protein (TIGR03437 family)